MGNSLAGSVNEEPVFVCDERGVQGRLEGRAGTAPRAVFGAQSQDLNLGAFKGTLPPYPGNKKAPDFVLMTPDNIAIVLGEAKVSWVPEHDLMKPIKNFEKGYSEEGFRRILGQYCELFIGRDPYLFVHVGQIAKYMLEMGLKYAFLTTYEQTTFLRKVNVSRAWGLEYSPVINHNDRGGMGTAVSFCEGLYHAGLLALADPDFGTSTSFQNQKWTVSV